MGMHLISFTLLLYTQHYYVQAFIEKKKEPRFSCILMTHTQLLHSPRLAPQCRGFV